MSLLEKICEELGVEVGEIFKMKPTGEDEQSFRLDSVYGLEVYNKTAEMWVSAGNHIYSDFITGRLKPKWKPKEGEIYYTPYINYNFDGVLHNRWEWHSVSESSKWHDKLGIVFKTKEEAVEVANKMLEVTKQD